MENFQFVSLQHLYILQYKQCQAAADAQTTPVDLSCKSVFIMPSNDEVIVLAVCSGGVLQEV